MQRGGGSFGFGSAVVETAEAYHRLVKRVYEKRIPLIANPRATVELSAVIHVVWLKWTWAGRFNYF